MRPGYFAVVAGAASMVRSLGVAAAVGAAAVAAARRQLAAGGLARLPDRACACRSCCRRPAAALRCWLVADLLLLLLLLFFGVISRLLPAAAAVPANLEWFVGFAWIGSLALAGLAAAAGRPPRVEHIAAVLFFLFTLVLALSAALLAALRVLPYGPAVLATVVIGQVAVAVFWLAWSPFLGSGLSTVFFRHVLSLGSAGRRMAGADGGNLGAPGLGPPTSGRARCGGCRSGCGCAACAGRQTRATRSSWVRPAATISICRCATAACAVYAERRWLPGAIFNLWMLARVASEFRQAKLREERRAAETAVRSVHEIGAKTTHDIKNILHVIRLMAKRPESSSPERMQQLGKLAARLEEALKSMGIGCGPGRDRNDAGRADLVAGGSRKDTAIWGS